MNASFPPQGNTGGGSGVPNDGSVTDVKVATGANINPAKIAGTAVVTADARLSDTRTPTDGTVTDAKISGTLSPSKITGTAVVTSDSRLSDARTPTDGSVTAAKVAASLKPSGTAATTDEALRALGTTASTAAAGNDSRLSDSRAPSGTAGGSLTGTYPNPTIATIPSGVTATTQAVDDNTAKVATDAFVLGQAASATPIVDGTGAVGTSTRYARADHVHPTDTSLVPKSLVDAKGDLFAGTADNTVARLAVGSDGQVLTADSAQSAGVKWATPSGGAASSGLVAAFPESGTFFQPPMLTSNSTTGSEGVMTAIPFVLGVARTLAQLDAKVSVAGGASSVIRIGLYADAGMYPGALIYDSGDIAAATATVKSATAIGAALAAGTVYWMTCVPRGVGGAVPTMVRVAQANGTTGSMFGDSTANSGFWFTNSQPLNIGFSQSGVSGALPATFTATRTPITSAIQIVGKVS